MSLIGWINPNFWYQLRYFSPHKLNGKWVFIKRDIALPYNHVPVVERKVLLLRYYPSLFNRWYSWMTSSGLYRRTVQSTMDHVVYRLKPRGNCFHDYVGSSRRKIRYGIFVKNKDPYCYMLQQARNIRMRHWRTFGWQVPEKQGPGPGLGFLPTHLDYPNKLTRMIEDDYTDTGVGCYALKMLPTLTIRKYFNELPRHNSMTYGIQYTKQDVFNHIAWGIDPGAGKLDQILNPTDPDFKAKFDEEQDIKKSFWPELYAAFEKDYQLKWPYPDDNVYRPTYNRGFTRKYWSREYY
jgi:hypothetical protein